jgi:NADH-quinone oxidoreductase subunit C
MKNIYEELKDRFQLSGFEQRDPLLAFITVPKEQAVALLTHLRDLRGYTHLSLMTCVDWLEQGTFQLTYLLHNYNDRTHLTLKVFLPRDNAIMESIHHLWEQARVYQQELCEMFGISFPGSPGQGVPMILEGWEGPPVMRRDFDTMKYSDEHYSHRPRERHEPEEHMKQKLYPED